MSFYSHPQLTVLLSDPKNRKCFDCGAVDPKWASVNNAVYLCLNCAGIHRGLGVQISFVRSLTMDQWGKKQIALMEAGGNTRLKNLMKEYKIPKNTIPEIKYNLKAFHYYRKLLRYEVLNDEMPEKPSIEEGINILEQQKNEDDLANNNRFVSNGEKEHLDEFGNNNFGNENFKHNEGNVIQNPFEDENKHEYIQQELGNNKDKKVNEKVGGKGNNKGTFLYGLGNFIGKGAAAMKERIMDLHLVEKANMIKKATTDFVVDSAIKTKNFIQGKLANQHHPNKERKNNMGVNFDFDNEDNLPEEMPQGGLQEDPFEINNENYVNQQYDNKNNPDLGELANDNILSNLMYNDNYNQPDDNNNDNEEPNPEPSGNNNQDIFGFFVQEKDNQDNQINFEQKKKKKDRRNEETLNELKPDNNLIWGDNNNVFEDNQNQNQHVDLLFGENNDNNNADNADNQGKNFDFLFGNNNNSNNGNDNFNYNGKQQQNNYDFDSMFNSSNNSNQNTFPNSSNNDSGKQQFDLLNF